MILPIGDVQRSDKVPFVNYALLAANIFVFFFLQYDYDEAFLRKWAFTPNLFVFHTFFTAMFLHANIPHLFGNMLFLWITGDNVEGRLGHVGYLVFYITAGVVASLAHYISDIKSVIPSLGASGAISGVIGAYFILCAGNKIKVFYWIWFYIGVILVPARLAIGFWILEQIILAMVWATSKTISVAVWAHIGGLAFGLAIIFLLTRIKLVTPQKFTAEYRPFRRRPAAFSTRRRCTTPPPAWENPYAKYSRQRNLFGQESPAIHPPPSNGTTPAVAIPLAGKTGTDFTVIALKPWQANYEGVVDAVAATLGVPFSTVSQRLQREYGVLAANLDDRQAKELVEKLEESGTLSLALSKADLLNLPPTYSIDSIVLHPGGFALYSGGHELSKSYRDIFLVVCGLVAGAGTGCPEPIVVDVCLFEPWARFRLVEGGSVSPYSQADNIRSTVMQMMRHSGNLPVNRGVRALLDGKDWTPVTFGSLEEFDRYSYWLIQVVNSKNRGLY